SLEWYDRALDTLTPIVTSEPQRGGARKILRNAYASRAQARMALKDYPQAAADWQRAAELTDEADRGRFRMAKMLCLAWAGDHVGATAEAHDLAARSPADPETLYNAACIFSLAAGSARADKKLSESYAARSVELLGMSFRATAAAKVKELRDHIKKDQDL